MKRTVGALRQKALSLGLPLGHRRWAGALGLRPLRFFFRVTLKRYAIVEHTHFIHEPCKLPVVLSQQEVARLLDAAPGLKYKAALSVAYGAGLRAAFHCLHAPSAHLFDHCLPIAVRTQALGLLNARDHNFPLDTKFQTVR
jgi:hypothetical protein